MLRGFFLCCGRDNCSVIYRLVNSFTITRPRLEFQVFSHSGVRGLMHLDFQAFLHCDTAQKNHTNIPYPKYRMGYWFSSGVRCQGTKTKQYKRIKIRQENLKYFIDENNL